MTKGGGGGGWIGRLPSAPPLNPPLSLSPLRNINIIDTRTFPYEEGSLPLSAKNALRARLSKCYVTYLQSTHMGLAASPLNLIYGLQILYHNWLFGNFINFFWGGWGWVVRWSINFMSNYEKFFSGVNSKLVKKFVIQLKTINRGFHWFWILDWSNNNKTQSAMLMNRLWIYRTREGFTRFITLSGICYIWQAFQKQISVSPEDKSPARLNSFPVKLL